VRTIVITRKNKFAGSLLPFWIISADVCMQIPARFQTIDRVLVDWNGQPRSTIHVRMLDEIGVRIKNGETVTVEVPDDVTAVYAVTMDGILSNECPLSGKAECKLVLTVKGGFRQPSYPWFENAEMVNR